MTTVLWVSKNSILPAQWRELKRLFGPDTRLMVDPIPFSGAAEVVARYRAVPEPREMVLVAPLSVIQQVCQRGVTPLYSKMEPFKPKEDERIDWDSCVQTNGRYSRFVGFERILNVSVDKGPVTAVE